MGLTVTSQIMVYCLGIGKGDAQFIYTCTLHIIRIMLTVSYNTVTADQVASLRDNILLGHVPVDS